MTERLTPWFDGMITPARKGVYERDYSDAQDGNGKEYAFCRWDGLWFMCRDTVREAAAPYRAASMYQNLKWRGLVKPEVQK